MNNLIEITLINELKFFCELHNYEHQCACELLCDVTNEEHIEYLEDYINRWEGLMG